MMNGKSLDEVIMSCDKDGNGLIDYNEFKAAMLVDWLTDWWWGMTAVVDDDDVFVVVWFILSAILFTNI